MSSEDLVEDDVGYEVENARGSVWHRWDPHIHSPGTQLNDQFGGPDPWEDYLARIEKSEPSIRALGVTDYCLLDNYERVVAAKRAGRLPHVGLIFPNVELRFSIATAKAAGINLHLLICPDDPNHVQEATRFLAKLEFRHQGENFSCDRNGLIGLGRKHDATATTDEEALAVGVNQFKVNHDQLREELTGSDWAKKNIIVGIAGSSNDGSAGLQSDASFAAQRVQLERMSQVIFASQPSQTKYWLGKGVKTPEELTAEYGGLKPCLHGSDAHTQAHVGEPALNRFTWVKGDLVFESLSQACIEPEGRVFIGKAPPDVSAPSQIIDRVTVENADWLNQPTVKLNSGLVAIIGARGSGKTALADILAAAAHALDLDNEKSFVFRAGEHLEDSSAGLVWANGDTSGASLNGQPDGYFEDVARVKYLSQQFVDQLCSADGVTGKLIAEIERVVFQAHLLEDRMGTADFQSLLTLKAARARSSRTRQEETLKEASTNLVTERAKKDGLAGLLKRKEEKGTQIKAATTDRSRLVGAGQEARVSRLTEVSAAIDAVREQVNQTSRRREALLALQAEVSDTRTSTEPARHRRWVVTHDNAGLTDTEWEAFKLTFGGDVDGILKASLERAEKRADALKGPVVPFIPEGEDLSTPFVQADAELGKLPLNTLLAENDRLQRQVGIDAENRRKYQTLTEQISVATSELTGLDREIETAQAADEKIPQYLAERSTAYRGVFSAIIEEQGELAALYAPVTERLKDQTGALGKLSFSVRRDVYLSTWCREGEALLDLRKSGAFQGKGSLEKAARSELLRAWQKGSAGVVADAMSAFRSKHDQDFLAHCPIDTTDRPGRRAWGLQLAEWLYGTSHIRVAYSVEYDGVDIEQLSPGTRGIVLLLLYLSLDREDNRPLIIDQPEENLDPKSIFDELVERFKTAKLRRQIIIVTHNANLVVNTDADQVIVASCGPHRPGQLPEITYDSGGLENPRIRKQVCEILEGGENAFKERARRLRVDLEVAS